MKSALFCVLCPPKNNFHCSDFAVALGLNLITDQIKFIKNLKMRAYEDFKLIYWKVTLLRKKMSWG